MRNFTRFSTVLAAALTWGVAACGDDANPGTSDTTTTTDATTATDSTSTDSTATTTTTDTTGDTNPTDPCTPNPCTTPPAADCDGNSAVTYAATGTCANNDGVAACTYAETPTPCTGTNVCVDGACVAGADKCTYTFDDKVSYVTNIRVGNQDANKDPGTNLPWDACCFDFTDDGKVDNKLGTILAAAASFTGDINALIQENIDSGSLALLLETKGVESATADDDLDIYGFYGADADADLTNNATGMSSFTVNPSSFVTGTATPLIGFEGAKIASSTLTAGPSLFQLSVPVVGAQLDLAVSNTQIEAVVATGPNGKGLTMDGTVEDHSNPGDTYGAKLGGVIKKSDLIAALNTFVDTCDCTFSGGATELISITGNTAKCNTSTGCTSESSACTQLPSFCGVLIGLIAVDVDLDGDSCPGTGCNASVKPSLADGISVGVFVKATSADISGVDTCE
ncbi:MAG: hypothetical protein U1F43_30260 [Myxococcota bacterium]